MRYIKVITALVLSTGLLLLAGCGGSSGGSAVSGVNPLDPFANVSTATHTTNDAAVTTETAVFELELSTDLNKPSALSELPQVDANDGTVLLTAKIVKKGDGVALDPVTNAPLHDGEPLRNQAVSFRILAGPGVITFSTPVTDANGEANAILTTGNVSNTTTVVVEASAAIEGKTCIDYTQFQIVRGNGAITFANEPKLEYTVPATCPPDETVDFLHPFSFLLTDANGNPRAGVPVTIAVYSIIPDDPQVKFDYTTINTGSDGRGWFNVTVTLPAPSLPGEAKSASIIYEATTHDPFPIVNYKGSTYSVKKEKQ